MSILACIYADCWHLSVLLICVFAVLRGVGAEETRERLKSNVTFAFWLCAILARFTEVLLIYDGCCWYRAKETCSNANANAKTLKAVVAAF